eukprot:CAMPEP_0204633032 /NCGR_PEP_ID=MMETSP0717-20131115/26258_1 /ASSEMBLY_ACC=CAM_ASM_000666 /TAXON_ID=230516 /ORGANISM="Chaetoceros curvisetus" /LENGTH=142 /DNA_ID=CAMNT_0051651061 /DNA_START=10 /DNA_END=435 /DNA_ORIENTATION=+
MSALTKSNYSESLSCDLTTTEQTLIFLNALFGKSLSTKILHVINSINYTSRTKEQSCKNKLLDSISIGSWRIENGNSQLSHPNNRDIVGTSSTASDGSHSMHDFIFLQFVGSQKNGMWISTVPIFTRTDDVTVVSKSLQSLW